MVGTRNDHELKILVGFLQGIHNLICTRRIYIIVYLAYYEHKRTLQLMGILHIATLHVT